MNNSDKRHVSCHFLKSKAFCAFRLDPQAVQDQCQAVQNLEAHHCHQNMWYWFRANEPLVGLRMAHHVALSIFHSRHAMLELLPDWHGISARFFMLGAGMHQPLPQLGVMQCPKCNHTEFLLWSQPFVHAVLVPRVQEKEFSTCFQHHKTTSCDFVSKIPGLTSSLSFRSKSHCFRMSDLFKFWNKLPEHDGMVESY